MMKSGLKRKEVVKLRRRTLSNGNHSLYLDIYWKGEREYEYLNLYLTDPKTSLERQTNKTTLLLAEQIRAQRHIDLQAGKYKIKRTMEHTSFIEYFRKLAKDRLNSMGNYGNWDSALKHLVHFSRNKDLTFADIDEAFLLKFKTYLLQENLTKGKEKLKQNTAHSYFNKLKAALRQAYEEKIINENPALHIRGIKPGETKREFLTWEEIQKINDTECDVKVLKRAFLFSVLTGLRWCDIMKMTWSEVRGSDTEGWYIRFQQQKTKDFEVLPISAQARFLLGQHHGPYDKVFIGLKYSAYTNVALSRWMLRANIHRNITFHCARHTHATLLLSQGVDIYVVSKLLGHKHVKTTEIYTKVTNIKKNEAINKIPTLHLSNAT
jgi:integrase